MRRRGAIGCGAFAGLFLLVVLGAVIAVVASIVGGSYNPASATEVANPDCTTTVGDGKPVESLSEDQTRNATIIVNEAHKHHLNDEAAAIGVAVGIVEANLHNYASRSVPASLNYPHYTGYIPEGDHDSVGLFQQRASGWGTLAQRMDPDHAAKVFFDALAKIDWQHMSFSIAANTVQVSKYPDRYGEHQTEAVAIVSALTGRHVTTTCTTSGSATGTAADLIAYAKTWRGVPYVWGGTTRKGVDCSGFTMRVYGHFGIVLPRISNDQGNYGPHVPISELVPGDLVAWDNSTRNNGADHVAIWIGNGKIIEAPHTGAVVRIEPMWGEDIAWGVHMHLADKPSDTNVNGKWRVPLKPGSYYLGAPFGASGSHWDNGHTGQDLPGVNIEGDPIYAAHAGTVVFSGWGGGYGNLVEIDVGGGYVVYYAHQEVPSPLQVNDRVRLHEVIGHVGATGNTTGPHLHFEIRLNDTPIDPVPFMKSHGAPL